MKTWQGVVGGLAVAVLTVAGQPAAGDPVPVPSAIDHLRGVREDEHLVLPAEGGAPLGRQRLRAWREGGVLHLTLDRRFANGERSREEATAKINGVLQPLGFHKRAFQHGQTEAQDIDFESGVVETTLRGETKRYEIDLPGDTYVGPMLAVVTAEIAARPERGGEFSTLALTPEPQVYKMRAEVLEQEAVDLGAGPQGAYEVRLRADLGPVKNMLLGSFVPAHEFWFTRDGLREFLAFRGTLGYEGPAVRILRSPRREALGGEAAGTRGVR